MRRATRGFELQNAGRANSPVRGIVHPCGSPAILLIEKRIDDIIANLKIVL